MINCETCKRLKELQEKQMYWVMNPPVTVVEVPDYKEKEFIDKLINERDEWQEKYQELSKSLDVLKECLLEVDNGS